MIVVAVLLFFASAGSPASRHATRQPPDRSPTSVRVYVFTEVAAAGVRTPDETERLEAVEDMRGALKRKKGITVVDDRAQANVHMEVTGRERREEPAGSFGGKSVTRMGDTIIRLRVKSGSDEAELKGMGLGTWGRAANDAAERFLKWIARREPKRLLASAHPAAAPAAAPIAVK
jgi:hypothetical protein